MNYIFGSGIIALLTRKILGDKWKIVPFGNSRYFSYNPALSDNFIIRDERLDEFVKNLNEADKPLSSNNILFYKKSWSINGQLISEYNEDLAKQWHNKVFGQYDDSVDRQISTKMTFAIYNARLNKIYESLVNEYREDLKSWSDGLPKVINMSERYFTANNKRFDYDNIVSTIPATYLSKLLGINKIYKSVDVSYVHLATEELDFEGANQVMVADAAIPFFKVSCIAPKRYLFYFVGEIDNPGVILMPFIKKFDILDGTYIKDAWPIGAPQINYDKIGITNIGATSSSNMSIDVGSAILHAFRYSIDGKIMRTIKL